MYCTKCGIQLKENAKFCGHCGAASAAETTPPPQPVQPMPNERGADQFGTAAVAKQPNYKLIGIIAGAVFVLLIGLIILIVALTNLADKIGSESASGNYKEANYNDEKARGTEHDLIRDVTVAQIKALNDRKANAYMATIDPEIRLDYETYRQIIDFYEEYDIDVKLLDFKILSVEGTSATGRMTIQTKARTNSLYFNDNVTTMKQGYIKYDGEWYMTDYTELEKTDYLN